MDAWDVMSILNSFDHLAAGTSAERPKGAPFLAVAGDAAKEMNRAVGKEKIHPSGMQTGEIIEPAIGIGRDVNPVVVGKNKHRRGSGGPRPYIAVAGTRYTAGYDARPNPSGLSPGAVADQDGIAGAVGNIANPDLAVAKEDPIPGQSIALGRVTSHSSSVARGCSLGDRHRRRVAYDKRFLRHDVRGAEKHLQNSLDRRRFFHGTTQI